MTHEFINEQLKSIDHIMSNTNKLIEIPYQNFLNYAITIGIILLVLPQITNIFLATIFLIVLFTLSANLSHYFFKQYFNKKERKFIYSDFMKFVNTVELFIVLFASLLSLLALSINYLELFYFSWSFSIGMLAYLYGFFTQTSLRYYAYLLITFSTLFFIGTLFIPFDFVIFGKYFSLILISGGLSLFAILRLKEKDV